MDRPDEIVCFQCGTLIGLATSESFVWTCPSCRHQLELKSDGGTQLATQRTRELVSRLEQLDNAYHRDAQQYMVLVGGSKASPARPFPPDQAGFQPAAVAILLGCAALFLLYLRQWYLGVATLVIGFGVFRFLQDGVNRKQEGYRRITETWQENRREILRSLYES